MAQEEHTVLIRKNIRLAQDQHLIFDKELDVYRVSFWRPRTERDRGHWVPAETYETMTRAAMVPKRSREYWWRCAGTSRDLAYAVRQVLTLGGRKQYYDDVIHYIGSTEWGAELDNSKT